MHSIFIAGRVYGSEWKLGTVIAMEPCLEVHDHTDCVMNAIVEFTQVRVHETFFVSYPPARL